MVDQIRLLKKSLFSIKNGLKRKEKITMKYQIINFKDGKYHLRNDSGTTIIVSEKTLRTCFWQVSLGVYIEK